ncbi:hypothetical protein M9H77_16660 [Catharanthus roseus]|uniref:Uncharacterized protein n=1 Tax=Catharanthus roseus TaxID=4058 RepID=A0ACC0B2C9_CATRO|nr:hypothetical protein M9H77_16660 [Catharanthus roseus]
MRAKYDDPIDLFDNSTSINASDSHTLTRMLKIIGEVEQYIGVCFRSRDSSFWWENCTHTERLKDHAIGYSYDPNLNIREVAVQDSLNGLFLRSLVPTACIADILRVWWAVVMHIGFTNIPLRSFRGNPGPYADGGALCSSTREFHASIAIKLGPNAPIVWQKLIVFSTVSNW